MRWPTWNRGVWVLLTILTRVRGYAGRGRRPDLGELVSILVLAVIGVWGVWFGVQSVLTLWWPLNAAYLVAGLSVAAVSAAVASALLNR